MTVPGCAS